MNPLVIFDLDETYIIKWAKETGYAIIVAAAATGGQILVQLSQTDKSALDTVQEWETWALTAGVAVARVVWAAFTNALRNPTGQ